MNNSKVVIWALTSLLSTSCGSENSDSKKQEADAEAVKAVLDRAKIKIEEVSKVGFTEVETGE